MKKILFAAIILLSSCINDLDIKPIDPNVIDPDKFKSNPEYYTQFLAKLYAGLAVSGQEGPAGRPDIEGFDEGMAQYLRAFWNLQELPTDEAVLGWNDVGIPELCTSKWSAANGFVYVMYSRIYFQIAMCNEFLRLTANINEVPEAIRSSIPQYRAEARFLRALSYWHAIDFFGNVPFVTENDPLLQAPSQQSRTFIFDFIMEELAAINENIPITPEYGRVGKGGLWMLEAKLLLNSQVYTNTPRYDECSVVCEAIIAQYGAGASHGLADEYRFLFCADNDRFARGGDQGEILLVVPYNGEHTRTYGGTMYLTIGSYGGKILPKDYGVNDGWGGPRSTPNLVQSFIEGSDTRYRFAEDGNTIVNTELSNYQNGYSVVKFTNLLSTDWDNTAGREQPYPDTDFPIFRMADLYLMYAECTLRGSGNSSNALKYINYVRNRAGVTPFTSWGDVSLDKVLAERMRELYWEGHRRTDLIRFEKFTSPSFLWSWKGGVLEGKSIDTKYRLYPIPAKEIAANPEIKQNYGY